MDIAFYIAMALLIPAVAACVWLWAQRSSLLRRQRELDASLADTAQQNESLRTENAKLGTEIGVAREKLRGLEEQHKAIDKLAQERFKALAGDVLEQSNKQFLSLAKKTFEGEQKEAAAVLEQRKQAIDAMLKPIRETLEAHRKAVTEIEKSREKAYGSLGEQLKQLLESERRLSQQTTTLANALRQGTGARGRWGEISLKRIAEMAQLVPHCDFDEQVTIHTGDASQRPDMVVHMPSQRFIVVDAKAPMTAYLDALEANEEDKQSEHLRRHCEHLEGHVRALSRKAYFEAFERTPDFVVLFIPGDSFLQPAVALKPNLIEEALRQKVVIATPTTLISLLKVIEMGWREQALADNAQRISEVGRELHKRLTVMTRHLGNLGKAVEKTVEHYNKFVGSFESQVLVQARRFEDLKADAPNRKLPEEGEIAPIEHAPRLLRSDDDQRA